MSDPTISRARLRDLARMGRFRLAPPGRAGLCETRASRSPRAASSRPEVGDLAASII